MVWDEEKKDTKELGFDRNDFGITLKEHWVDMDKKKFPYNLAAARNIGILEAEGEILIFNDSRLKADENAVMMFVEAVKNASSITMGGNKKIWFFGDKGSQKQSFIENWSAVKREFLVSIGMFNERINRYGGMTQEVRSRWKINGGDFTYISQAVSSEVMKSGRSPERMNDIVKSKMKIYKLFGDRRF